MIGPNQSPRPEDWPSEAEILDETTVEQMRGVEVPIPTVAVWPLLATLKPSAWPAILRSPSLPDDMACEMLRDLSWLSGARRCRVLAAVLRTGVPRRRYAAAVGLADLNTPAARAYLVEAVRQDPLALLRKRMQRLLDLLPPVPEDVGKAVPRKSLHCQDGHAQTFAVYGC